MVSGLALAAVLYLAGLGAFRAEDKDTAKGKPKYTIEDVMEKAHDEDDGLLKKVIGGKSEKKDRELLLELYTALGQNKPPKGSADSWKEKTGKILKAAQTLVKDEKEGIELLKKAVNCKACHDIHREK